MANKPRGKAFIEVVAETDRFEEALDRSLVKAVREASRAKNFDPLVAAAEAAAASAATSFGRRFSRDVNGRLRDVLTGRFVAEFATAGLSAGTSFFESFAKGFSGAASAAPITGNLLRGATGALASIAESGPLGIIGAVVAFLPIVGLLIVALPFLISLIFAVGGALFSLIGILGALPGPVFALIAAIAPLLLIFRGFGETIGALVEGDIEKFNESLKKLSPSARAVAKEFQRVLPFFKQLRVDVQEAFFSRIGGFLTTLVKVLGPTVSAGLQNIGFALGQFFAVLAEFAARPETANFLSSLFQFTASAIAASGPVLIQFLSALFVIMQASFPILSTFGTKIGESITAFSAFLTTSAQTGAFQSFLESGLLTLGDLLGVTKEFFGLLKDMFLTTDESGRTFLQDVRDSIAELRIFFQSPEGKEFIENMIVLAEDFGDILVFVARTVGEMIGTFAAAIELADDLGGALEKLARAARTFGSLNLGSGLAALILPGFAHGGITSGPSLAGEAGPEAILPLDNPVRAREIASDPQVASVLGDGDTTVIAVFDGEPFQARITRTVNGATARVATSLSQKPRFAGV
jgi:hypothetical protein